MPVWLTLERGQSAPAAFSLSAVLFTGQSGSWYTSSRQMGPIWNSDLKPHPANHQPILSTSQGCWHSTMESSRIRKGPRHADCLTCYYPHVNCHPQWRWRVSLSLVRYFLNLWKMFSHLLSHVLDPKQASWTFVHPSPPFFRGATRGQPLFAQGQTTSWLQSEIHPCYSFRSISLQRRGWIASEGTGNWNGSW